MGKMVTRVEGNTLVFEREFKAPRELVFSAYTEAEHLKRWWGPQGWSVPVCTVDLRPGGVWHYCMKCEDRNQGDFYGMESWGKAVYQEIDPPNKLVYTDYFSDAEGNEAEGMPSTLTTMSFETIDENTTKVIGYAAYASPEALKTVLDMGMEQGMGETMDRLEELLAEIQ